MGLLFPSLSMALNSIHLVYQVIYFGGASLNGALFRALNSFATALLPSTEQCCPTRFFPPAEWIQWMELSSVFQIAQLLCNTPPAPTSHVSLPLLSLSLSLVSGHHHPLLLLFTPACQVYNLQEDV